MATKKAKGKSIQAEPGKDTVVRPGNALMGRYGAKAKTHNVKKLKRAK